MKQNRKALLQQEIAGTPELTYAPVVLDIAGTSLSEDDRRRLEHPLTGGVILFARNWQSRTQLCDLTSDIKSIRPDVLIAVDHEGGRVQRFRSDGFTIIPAMRALGQLWVNDDLKQPGKGPLAAVESATACGYVLAAELRACGVDFSFTPVLDLDWGKSEVVGNRSFSHDPRVVSLLARSVMQGLKIAGMSNCGKHFPGHGFVQADSHTAVPVDERSLQQILKYDVLPYQTLGIALDAVMPAHVVYSQVDSLPAGYSSRWLQDILRGELEFNGCIFSDDLSMEGGRYVNGKLLDYTQAAVLALQAGCDMVLLCNQSVNNAKALDGLLDGLWAAQQKEEWTPRLISEYRRRVLLPQQPAPTWEFLMDEPRYLQAQEAMADL
jgi:beta-N-acetylhexosaminidase